MTVAEPIERQRPPGDVIVGPWSSERTSRAALEARHELGPEYEPQIVDFIVAIVAWIAIAAVNIVAALAGFARWFIPRR